MHQQHDPRNWSRLFGAFCALMLIHQRAIIVPMRKYCGKDFFGLPCGLALLLMSAWAFFSGDDFMWVCAGFWLVALLVRKGQTYRLLAQGTLIYSLFDGIPTDAQRYCKTERTAKLFVEPILVGILGGTVLLIYRMEGLPVAGLPLFFLFGLVSLPLIELLKQTIWERRLQAMQDARIEQEAVVQEVRIRYGE
jgi:hypothetical protein